MTDPQKVLTPPASLFLSRAHCYLSTSRPLLALSDANKALKLDKECLPAKITKAESLYHLLMIEKSLMMFTRLIKEKPTNRAAKMGRAKCCQAIENSIAEDCFDVPNIEEIFQSSSFLQYNASSVQNNFKKQFQQGKRYKFQIDKSHISLL